MSQSTATTVPGRSVWDGGVSPMGVSYGKLMMWFFLLSDAFTFSGLLITYGLIRSQHPAFTGAHDAFVFSHDYWPVPEKVFEAVPFLHVRVLSGFGLRVPPMPEAPAVGG